MPPATIYDMDYSMETMDFKVTMKLISGFITLFR